MNNCKELGFLKVEDLHLISGGQAGSSISWIEHCFGDFMKVGPRLVLLFFDHINKIFKYPFDSFLQITCSLS